MINTVNTKREQLSFGYFKIGSGSEVIFFLGSCRSVPYLNYFNDWNVQNGNRFTIAFIDPYNFNYDLSDNRVNLEANINSLETNQNILDLFKRTKYFVHEHYVNFGMFNVDKNSPKNIFQFGMNPEYNISIPAFNDCFILIRDIVSFDLEIKREAIADYNVTGKLSEYTLSKINIIKNKNLDRFYNNCSKTDFPEFAEIFSTNYKSQRFFWNSNHVGKAFTKCIFRLLNEKFLHLDLSNYRISEVDMYENPRTSLCEYDENYKWNEPVTKLKEVL